MIKLDTDKWCENCPEFQAHLVKKTYQEYDEIVDKRVMKNDTVVECYHRQRCMSMKRFLERENEK